MLKALGFKVRNVLDVVDDDVSVGKFVLSIPSQNLCQYLREDYQNWRFLNKLTVPRRNEASYWENMLMNAFWILILQALGNATRKLEKNYFMWDTEATTGNNHFICCPVLYGIRGFLINVAFVLLPWIRGGRVEDRLENMCANICVKKTLYSSTHKSEQPQYQTAHIIFNI